MISIGYSGNPRSHMHHPSLTITSGAGIEQGDHSSVDFGSVTVRVVRS